MLQDKNFDYYPVLIECKGCKDKLVKCDKDGQVENRTSKNDPHFKNINLFAVNGAVHYANALLHHTSYTDIIAIGMTGYKYVSNPFVSFPKNSITIDIFGNTFIETTLMVQVMIQVFIGMMKQNIQKKQWCFLLLQWQSLF